MNNVQDVLNTFSQVSGLNVVLVDMNYHPIAESGNIGDDFCASIHVSQKCLDCCLISDEHAFSVVKKTGKTYLYTCPFGFFQAVVPVTNGNNVVAYMIVSLVAEEQPRPVWEKHVIDAVRSLDPTLNTKNAQIHLCKTVMVPRSRLEACVNMLEMLAGRVATCLPEDVGNKTLAESIKAYIDNHLHKKITLAALSITMHCSTVTLTEHFRKEYGLTIMQYVMNKRIELAKRLLSQTKLPVKDVSSRCGFADVEYFSRCFKESCGDSPNRWRINVVE